MVIKKGADRPDVGASRRPRRLEWVGGVGGGVWGGGSHQIPGHLYCPHAFDWRRRRFVGGLLILSPASLSGNLVAADKILSGIG